MNETRFATSRGEVDVPSTGYALHIEDLGFSYGKKSALEHVNLAISPGELVILLGPNGAGKTTLFSLICGLFAPDEGNILINGQSLLARADALAPLGIVFQSQTLDLDLSVEQNLLYFCSLHGIGKDQAKQRIVSGLQRFEMLDRAKDKVRTLNGGHRRRVELLRATLHLPSILLLDEPTVGLDIPTRAELVDYLRALPSENHCAVLWATHLVDEIRRTDRVMMLHQGRCVLDGPAQNLLQSTQTDDLAELMQSTMQSSMQSTKQSQQEQSAGQTREPR